MKKWGLLFFVAALMACSNKDRKNELSEKKIFRYNESAGVTSIDPAKASRFENMWVVNQVFNGLVKFNNNMEVEADIAKSWELSEDGKVYTFHLRDDVCFHDDSLFTGGIGRKVGAEDFVYSIYRLSSRDVNSPAKYLTEYLDKSAKSNFVGALAVNDSTLNIYLKNPFEPFLEILGMQFFCVVPSEVVAHYGDDFGKNPIGTGPFKFKVWKQDVKLVLERNENYYEKDDQGNALPYLDGVAVSFKKDRKNAFMEFDKGHFDLVTGLHPSYKDDILTPEGELRENYSDNINLQKGPYLKTDYIGVQMESGLPVMSNSPLKMKKIRQALNYGFDRVELLSYQKNNIGNPAVHGFVPLGMPDEEKYKVDGYTFDRDKALRLIHETGLNLKEMPITIHTAPDYREQCVYLQAQWKELGFIVHIDVVDPSVYSMNIVQGKYGLFKKSWIADFSDPINFLQLFYSGNFPDNGSNYMRFSNREFDRLYEKAITELDMDVRYGLYKSMDSIIVDEAPVIPLYYDEVVRFVQKKVENLELNPMNLLDLTRVKMN